MTVIIAAILVVYFCCGLWAGTELRKSVKNQWGPISAIVVPILTIFFYPVFFIFGLIIVFFWELIQSIIKAWKK